MLKESKTGYRVFLAVLVWLLAATAATAASPLVGSSAQGGGDEALDREVEGGLHLKLISVKKNNSDCFWITWTVTSDSDIKISIEGGEVFDSAGNKFTPTRYNGTYYIGNEDTRDREIIANVPTQIGVRYQAWDAYTLPSTLARMEFKINGKPLLYRNVPTQ